MSCHKDAVRSSVVTARKAWQSNWAHTHIQIMHWASSFLSYTKWKCTHNKEAATYQFLTQAILNLYSFHIIVKFTQIKPKSSQLLHCGATCLSLTCVFTRVHYVVRPSREKWCNDVFWTVPLSKYLGHNSVSDHFEQILIIKDYSYFSWLKKYICQDKFINFLNAQNISIAHQKSRISQTLIFKWIHNFL